MTDLETALNAQIAELKEAAIESERKADELDLIGSSAYGRGVSDAHQATAEKLEELLAEHTEEHE